MLNNREYVIRQAQEIERLRNKSKEISNTIKNNG